MYKEITANKRKTAFLVFLFVILVVGISWVFAEFMGSSYITPFVLIGVLIYALIGYLVGSKMALAVNGAHEIEKKDNPRLWRVVENISITEGLPMPKVYIMDDPAPNAFATGRDPNHSAVAATTGLLEIMSDTELEGVMAHEMGHIKNYDIRVSMIVFALVAVIAVLADIMLRMTWFRSFDDDDGGGSAIFFAFGIVAAILAPLIAAMIQMAVSRKREFLADATGALATRYPEGLASALEKIQQYGRPMRKQNSSTAHLFFANPLKAKGLANMFSTHPPVEERIHRLRTMGAYE